MASGVESEKIEQICPNNYVQNANSSERLRILRTRGLVGINRSERCLFHIPIHPTHRHFLMFAIQLKHSIKSIQKGIGSYHGSSAQSRCTYLSLLRRLSNHRKVQKYAREFCTAISRYTESRRFC